MSEPQLSQSKNRRRRRADQYNDAGYNYQQYWQGREYEHAAEEMALRRLLRGRHFKKAVDVGGGYGRLCLILKDYADKVVLAEPSQQQLNLAEDFLQGQGNIERKLMQADDLQFADGSVDLVTMIRVMHHLPNPIPELSEIVRILSPDGCAIIELANYAHGLNRLKHLIRGQRLSVKPVDIRSQAHKSKDEIPFVNHNPYTFMRQLAHAGLPVERVLSVSNLRSPKLKKILSQRILLSIEKIAQRRLASFFFGPSIFFLVRKSAP